jgi:hypothetical protein
MRGVWDPPKRGVQKATPGRRTWGSIVMPNGDLGGGILSPSVGRVYRSLIRVPVCGRDWISLLATSWHVRQPVMNALASGRVSKV